MKHLRSLITFAVLSAVVLTPMTASAQSYPPHIATPDKLESSLGTLEFKDGAPSKETTQKVYDYLDLMHGVQAFVSAYQGASVAAIMKGAEAAGAPMNTHALIWSMMDAKSLMLTAQSDTIYWWMNLDLSKGPLVLESPPMALGMIDDAWFGWVTDIGLPGPDRGLGGKYLVIPPGYTGELPESGYIVTKPRTIRVTVIGRAFLESNDAKDAKAPVALIKQTLKVYPYLVGGYGSTIGAALDGKGTLARTPDHKLDVSYLKPQPPVTFVEATGKVMSTIPPSDYTYFELINEVVQREPAGSLDPEIMGHLAAIGIVKGKPFNPDARMKKILTDAAAIGSATGRIVTWNPREAEGFAYYPGSKWMNWLFVGGYTFERPPAEVSSDGTITIQPSDGARKIHSRLGMYFYATGITPAMVMKLTGIGSEYIMALMDSNGEYLDGAKTYKVTLPKDIPAERFWSLTVYDNQTRSMLDTPQRFPRAGSQNFPTPAAVANPDGSTTVYFGPTKPEGVGASNWIQTLPGKGFNVILRCYSPKESFFTKTWRPSEVELVK